MFFSTINQKVNMYKSTMTFQMKEFATCEHTLIAIINHFSCKLSYQPSCEMLSTPLD
jgi:hypothetical protein